MVNSEEKSSTLWLLKGAREVPGWGPLERDARSGETDVLIFDRSAGWALIAAEHPPKGYKEMEAVPPKDGLYVSETGYPIYVVACREVRDALTVIKAVGAKAEKMLEALGDPDTVLQRLGLAY